MTFADKDRFRPTPHFRQQRRQHLARVQLRKAGGPLQDIMVRDVSASGVSAVASGQPPAENEVVTLRLPDGTEYWGLVRWVEGQCFGVAFDTRSQDEGHQRATIVPGLPGR